MSVLSQLLSAKELSNLSSGQLHTLVLKIEDELRSNDAIKGALESTVRNTIKEMDDKSK